MRHFRAANCNARANVDTGAHSDRAANGGAHDHADHLSTGANADTCRDAFTCPHGHRYADGYTLSRQYECRPVPQHSFGQP